MYVLITSCFLKNFEHEKVGFARDFLIHKILKNFKTIFAVHYPVLLRNKFLKKKKDILNN